MYDPAGSTGASGTLADELDDLNPLPPVPTHSWGSQQWRLLRRALRDGQSIEEAAATAGICVAEAKDLAKLDAERAPLPEEAFALLYHPDAPRAASVQTKEPDMAKDEDEAGEYKRPDAALAFKIYDQQIKPKEAHLATIKGDMSEPYQSIKDTAHFPRKVLNFILAIESEEDAKRDHHLLALSEGLKHRKLFLPRDLVTMAEGEDGGDIVGTEDRDDDDLLVDGVIGESDLAGTGEAIQIPGENGGAAPVSRDPNDFTEATPEELSAQEGREKVRAPRRTARTATVTSIASPATAH